MGVVSRFSPAMLAAIRCISVLNERRVDHLAGQEMLIVSVLLSLCCVNVGMN